MTLMIRYDYVSWERLFPGYGVDLTALRFEPPDDFRAGADSALKHLRLGRSPKPGTVAEIHGDIEDALASAADVKSCYAAVFYPKPKRSAEHLRLEFSAYDNTRADLSLIDAMRREVLEPAPGEIVIDGPDRIELPCGPALRMLQTVTRAPEDGAVRTFPCLTICGSNDFGGTLFVIRSHATTQDLTEVLDELVTAWASGLICRAETPVRAGTGSPYQPQ